MEEEWLSTVKMALKYLKLLRVLLVCFEIIFLILHRIQVKDLLLKTTIWRIIVTFLDLWLQIIPNRKILENFVDENNLEALEYKDTFLHSVTDALIPVALNLLLDIGFELQFRKFLVQVLYPKVLQRNCDKHPDK